MASTIFFRFPKLVKNLVAFVRMFAPFGSHEAYKDQQIVLWSQRREAHAQRQVGPEPQDVIGLPEGKVDAVHVDGSEPGQTCKFKLEIAFLIWDGAGGNGND